MKKTITNHIILATLFLCSFSAAQLSACSCGEFPTFCERAVNQNLFMGRVIDHQEATYNGNPIAYFTNLEVIDFMNSTSLPNIVSMVNQDGVNCNGSINGLAVGDSVIISISNLEYDVEYNDFENVPTHIKYDLFGCGTYFLVVNGGVVGGVSSTQETVSLSSFLQNPQDNCPQVSNTVSPLAGQIDVYPNPVKERFTIDNRWQKKIHCSLYDFTGVLVSQFAIWPNQQEQLPLTDMPAGPYLLKMEDGLHEYSQVIIRQ